MVVLKRSRKLFNDGKKLLDNTLRKIGTRIRKSKKVSGFFSTNFYISSGVAQISRLIPNTAAWMGFFYFLEKLFGITITGKIIILWVVPVILGGFILGYLWKHCGFLDNEAESVNKKNVVQDVQYEAAKLIMKRMRKNGKRI